MPVDPSRTTLDTDWLVSHDRLQILPSGVGFGVQKMRAEPGNKGAAACCRNRPRRVLHNRRLTFPSFARFFPCFRFFASEFGVRLGTAVRQLQLKNFCRAGVAG
jgi:hypothetical protein